MAAFTTPMIGGFTRGRGLFYARGHTMGDSILSRFLWTDITPTSCHWEQAFWADGGARGKRTGSWISPDEQE